MALTRRAASALEASIVFPVLALFFLAARIYSRLRVAKRAGIDDIFIVFGWIFAVGFTATVFVQVKYGMGQHQTDLSEGEQLLQLKPFYASIILYNISLSCIKLSFLLQYYRIFVQPFWRRFIFIMLGVVGVYSAWTIISAIIPCLPVAFFWNDTIAGGHCLNRFNVWIANASLNIVTDLMIVLLPMPVLHTLQMRRRERNALIGVFAIAGCVCVISICRLHSLIVISESTDISWTNPPAAIYSMAEMNIGIMCACAPTLKGLILNFFPRIFGSRNTNGHHSRPSYTTYLDSSTFAGPKTFSGTMSRIERSDTDVDEELIGFDQRDFVALPEQIKVRTSIKQDYEDVERGYSVDSLHETPSL